MKPKNESAKAKQKKPATSKDKRPPQNDLEHKQRFNQLLDDAVLGVKKAK